MKLFIRTTQDNRNLNVLVLVYSNARVAFELSIISPCDGKDLRSRFILHPKINFNAFLRTRQEQL